MWNLLRQRNFSLVLSARVISNSGDIVLYVALPFYVYQLTGSALATGAMFVAETIPPILLGSLAGVFVDRWHRKRTMIVADVARAMVLLLLLFVGSVDALPLVFVVAFVNACLSQFFSPAQGALLPHLVSAEDLAAANSLNSSAGQIPLLLGPVVGGVLLSWVGLPFVVLADSASFLLSALLVALVIIPPDSGANRSLASVGSQVEQRSIVDDLIAGLRLVRENKLVAGLFATVAVVMLAQGIKSVALVTYVTDTLHGDAGVRGLMVTAQGVGGIIGGVLLASFGRLASPQQRIILGVPLIGVLLLVMTNLPQVSVVLLMMALIGIVIIACFPSITTLLQSAVEDRYRGRVLGAYGTVIALSNLLGLLLASAIGDLAGSQLMMNLTGVLYVFSGAVAFLMLRGLPRAAGIERQRKTARS